MSVYMMLSFSGDGGVEKMAVNLMKGFCDLGEDVNLLRIKNKGNFVKNIPEKVKIFQLPSQHTYFNLPYMIKFLKTHPIKSLLVMKERAGIMSLIAKTISRSNTKIFIRFGTHLTRSLREKNSPLLYTKFRLFILKKLLPKADGIIAVSKGVLDDIVSLCPEIRKKGYVIRNPVITHELSYLALEEARDDWLKKPRKIPVVVGMGRITYQKDFKTLILACHLALKKMPLRLLILGEGPLKKELKILSEKLGIKEHVKFAGFKKNPYPYLKNADLFVLSSRWEGSPNALTEALALGTPSIATNCMSGPKEILRGGELGPLVPVGDYKTLSEKIIEVLTSPPKKEKLTQGVQEYHYLTSAKKYLELLSL